MRLRLPILLLMALLLVAFPACAREVSPEASVPEKTPQTGASPPAEGYKYVDGLLKGLKVNGGTVLVISTSQGELRQFRVTENTRFEIDGSPCGAGILAGRENWELSVYYWQGSDEAESVIIRSHPGWVWEATLVVEASIIPGPAEAPEKRTLKIRVVDSLSQKPVPDAGITLHLAATTPTPQAPQSGPLILGATNEAGELVRDVNPSWQGRYIVRAKKGSYNPGETEIDFSAPATSSLPDRVPAIRMPEGKPVVVSQEELEKSPGLEIVDILISINGEALFIVLEDDSKLDQVAFSNALSRQMGKRVDIIRTAPFLWLKVQGLPTRDEVEAALRKVEEELRWWAGRAIGWGNYW